MMSFAQKNIESGNFIGDKYVAKEAIINKGILVNEGDAVFKSELISEQSVIARGGLQVNTISEAIPGNCITVLNEVKVDVINENGLGMGVIIEGVVIKDGTISVPVLSQVQCIRDMNADTEVCANNNDTISMSVAGIEKGLIRTNGGVQFGQGSAPGNDSFAIGINTVALGEAAMAQGHSSEANALRSHAEGFGTMANAPQAHAEGESCIANATNSHVEGLSTIANGANSHAEGREAESGGDNSHAEGRNTVAGAPQSHAEGQDTQANGTNSHSEGRGTIADAEGAHAEGISSTAGNSASHAEGDQTAAMGDASHSEGLDTLADAQAAHAEGCSTTAEGDYSHAEGQSTNKGTLGLASGTASHVEGVDCIANDIAAHAEGNTTVASADSAHSEGRETTASGPNSHAEGLQTTASGENSHAEGFQTAAPGENAHVEGENTVANGRSAHSEGSATTADAFYSHAEGLNSECKNTALAGHAAGVDAVSISRAQYSRGSGRIATPGDAQFCMYHYSGVSSSPSIFEMFMGIVNARAVVPNNHSWCATLDIIGRDMVITGEYCDKIFIRVRNSSGVLSIQNASFGKIQTGQLVGTSVIISAILGNQLQILITPPTNNLCHWAATLQVTQVG